MLIIELLFLFLRISNYNYNFNSLKRLILLTFIIYFINLLKVIITQISYASYHLFILSNINLYFSKFIYLQFFFNFMKLLLVSIFLILSYSFLLKDLKFDCY